MSGGLMKDTESSDKYSQMSNIITSGVDDLMQSTQMWLDVYQKNFSTNADVDRNLKKAQTSSIKADTRMKTLEALEKEMRLRRMENIRRYAMARK